MLRLGLAAILLVGLVVTTPVLCVCDLSDHAGLAVHSLLPHTHQPIGVSAHVHGTAEAADDAPSVGRTPAVSAQTGSGAASLAAGGAIQFSMTPPWQLYPLTLGRTSVPPLLPWRSDRRPPPGPPPRLLAR